MDKEKWGNGACENCSIPHCFDGQCVIKEKIKEFVDAVIKEYNDLIEVSLAGKEKQKTPKQRYTALVQRQVLVDCKDIIQEKFEELYS